MKENKEQTGWNLETRVVGMADITGSDVIQLNSDRGGDRVGPATRFTFNFAFPKTGGFGEAAEKQYAVLVDGDQSQFAERGKVEIIELKAGPSISHAAVVRVPSESFVHAGIFTELPKKVE